MGYDKVIIERVKTDWGGDCIRTTLTNYSGTKRSSHTGRESDHPEEFFLKDAKEFGAKWGAFVIEDLREEGTIDETRNEVLYIKPTKKPKGYEAFLAHKPCIFKCGLCRSCLGFEIVVRMGEDLFEKLKREHNVEYDNSVNKWYVLPPTN